MPEILSFTTRNLGGERLREMRVTEHIGAVMQVLFATDRRSWRIASIQAFVDPPVQLRQIEFLTNPAGRVLGYATWAFLSEESEAALVSDPLRVLEIDEWNEGICLWIMDVVVPGEGFWQLRRQLQSRFPHHQRVRWLRRKRTDTALPYCEMRIPTHKPTEPICDG